MPSVRGVTTQREQLTPQRVLEGATAVADSAGLTALTMRSLAEHLGVKPMSLYHHVANKDEILNAIVDLVFGEIELPVPGSDWRPAMRERAASRAPGAQPAPVGDGADGARVPTQARRRCAITTPSSGRFARLASRCRWLRTPSR